ncbi:VCBS repeat-containing protein [Nonomuraea sp. B19D2]|uniref:FG-GAP repeat domain-containing protein n=1 Tax=Nonomuraea sp. B19D2 TaxID=3159561 RepID=UPI0032DB7888
MVGYSAPVDAGTGPVEAEDATGAAVDFDGDGKADLVGVSTDGTLRAYRGTGTPGTPSIDGGTVVGTGWTSITRITVLDADNDGKVDLVGRASDGMLYAYLNNGNLDFSTRVTIGEGWNGVTRVNVGDFDGDGKTDVLGQASDGTLRAYLNKGTPGAPNISTNAAIGSGWNGITRLAVVN